MFVTFVHLLYAPNHQIESFECTLRHLKTFIKLCSILDSIPTVSNNLLQTVFSEECKFEWFLSKDPAQTSLEPTSSKKPKLENLKSKGWEKRREGFFFKPENCDIGECLLLVFTVYSLYLTCISMVWETQLILTFL